MIGRISMVGTENQVFENMGVIQVKLRNGALAQ
jgi:hypothetical protein